MLGSQLAQSAQQDVGQTKRAVMGTRLYVGNLAYSTTEDALREVFEATGKAVSEVHVVMDRDTGRSRGFAFVQMASEADAQAIMEELDGKDLDGRPLRVNEARERKSGGGRH
jgi:RNA recognition motif-containing protein